MMVTTVVQSVQNKLVQLAMDKKTVHQIKRKWFVIAHKKRAPSDVPGKSLKPLQTRATQTIRIRNCLAVWRIRARETQNAGQILMACIELHVTVMIIVNLMNSAISACQKDGTLLKIGNRQRTRFHFNLVKDVLLLVATDTILSTLSMGSGSLLE